MLSSSRLPNPLHHVSDIRIYINSPGGSRIMSLFLSQMSYLVHYEGHRMFVTRVIFVETTDHVCPDWVSCSNAPVFQVPGLIMISLMPPNVPHYTKCPLTTLKSEFMAEKPAKNVKREIQRRYSRRDGEHLCVCQNLFCNVFIFH